MVPPEAPAVVKPPVVEELFLKYQYVETKDLCSKFLTLVSGILVFSVTFAKDILNFPGSRLLIKWCLISCWLSLFVSLTFCGAGLYLIFLAMEQASGSIIIDYGRDFRTLTLWSYKALDIAGISFVLSIFIIVCTGIYSVCLK